MTCLFWISCAIPCLPEAVFNDMHMFLLIGTSLIVLSSLLNILTLRRYYVDQRTNENQIYSKLRLLVIFLNIKV